MTLTSWLAANAGPPWLALLSLYLLSRDQASFIRLFSARGQAVLFSRPGAVARWLWRATSPRRRLPRSLSRRAGAALPPSRSAPERAAPEAGAMSGLESPHRADAPGVSAPGDAPL